jgi:TIR domain
MPIFISYSRKDRSFVDQLATNLVIRRHNVWLDKWELSVGDSLIDKIQGALTESSAILIILSKHSFDSNWCRKEVNAGLMRELEQKQSILIPCLIDDCVIPLFLKEKLYADFTIDKDEAFNDVYNELAKITNPMQNRIETPDFHIDWSTAYGDVSHRDIPLIDIERGIVVKFIELTFVEHSEKWPYIILSQWVISFRFDQQSNKNIFGREAARELYIRDVISLVVENLPKWTPTIMIDSALPKKEFHKLIGSDGRIYEVEFICRRLGVDNGMLTLYHGEGNIKRVLQHMKSVTLTPRTS